jgi:hypothetical protein
MRQRPQSGGGSTNLFNRDRYRKKLQELLSIADDEAFFEMIWAIDALQSERVEAASRCIRFPPEAATSEMASHFRIYKWELETLINQLLITPKAPPRSDRNRILDCRKFAAGANTTNFLRKLENAESGIYLQRFSIWTEMHRIGQRQFPWQRGRFAVLLYRYAYIYGQGECRSYFERANGISMNEFSLIGFALYPAFQDYSQVQRRFSLTEFDVSPAVFEAALSLLSAPIAQARCGAASLIRGIQEKHRALPIADHPSFLRGFPIVSFETNGSRLRAPIPELILLRITSGLFYDLIKGGSHLRNEAADRFEQYSAEYISAMMRRFDVNRSHKYRISGNEFDTPDILVKDGGKVAVAIECKARKLSFGAQFSDDPIEEAKEGFEELAKGVFQLWRYFSHARRGLVASDIIRPDAYGMVLTLDTWLMMSGPLQGQLVAAAAKLAETEPEITAEDRCAVVFCSIHDLETTLANATEDSFLRTMGAACEGRFVGWILPNIHRETEDRAQTRKPFPFQVGDVLPWWKATDEMSRRLGERSDTEVD